MLPSRLFREPVPQLRAVEAAESRAMERVACRAARRFGRMPAWRAALRSDRGNAALEFVTAGLILLVPTVYLVVALASIQGAQLAVAGAARQAARVYVQSASERDASAEASAAVAFALADFGLAPDAAAVSVQCSPHPDDCLTRRGTVTVTVRVSAALPLVPDVLDLRRDASVAVQATSTQQVSRLWSGR